MERWLPIIGYETIYEISDAGRVKALARVTERNGRPYRKRERMLKPQPHTGGYRFVSLYDEAGLCTQCYIHRLVLQHFAPAQGTFEVNHKNFDKTDNRVGNLEWVTRQENHAHAVGHGRYHGRTNPNFQRKLSPDDVGAILADPGSSEEVGAQYGVSGSMVLHIRNGRRWQEPTWD